MALKRKIDEDAFKALPKDIQNEYTKSGDEYVLDVEGIEDAGEIKRAKDNEVKEHAKTKKKLADATAEVETLKAGGADDVKAANTKAEAKYNKDIGERDTRIGRLTDGIRNKAIESTAKDIATRISKVPALMVGFIRDNLIVELDDTDSPVIRVKGADGKADGRTLEQLEKGLVNDKQFADIIIAGKASGGGGAPRSPSNPGGGAPNNSPDDKPADLGSINPKDLASRIAARKEQAAQT